METSSVEKMPVTRKLTAIIHTHIYYTFTEECTHLWLEEKDGTEDRTVIYRLDV